MTEAEARPALAAFAGEVEPWIARQAWEATPSGWTVPVPLDGWIFRLEPAPGGVRVIASAGDGREPVAWAVPRRAAGR